MWSDVALGGAAAVFLSMTASTLFHQRWARRLPALQARSASRTAVANGDRVRCSVVVPARDEEARVEAAVRRLLGQRDVAVDVIVVDDRSTDRTGEILQRLAAEDPRVRAARVDVLPDGWLGKCHACHVGASLATGEWILFTDADCWLKPDVLARALQAADRESADHITLTPGMAAESLGARAWHLVFLASLAGWISRVNRDRPRGYLGIGAFNLVRAIAYRNCGGYAALRLTVVDDVKLGLLLQRAGARTRAFIGGDDAECHWGTTVGGMFKIMEKNYFAAADFRLAAPVAAVVFPPLLLVAALTGPFTGTLAGASASIAALSLMLPAAAYARRLGWSFAGAALAPFFYVVVIAAFVNSAVVTLRQGGIWWRDTFYSLDTLRKGHVR